MESGRISPVFRAVAAQVVGDGVVAEAGFLGDGRQHLQAFAHHLGAGAVAGDDSYAVHAVIPFTWWLAAV